MASLWERVSGTSGLGRGAVWRVAWSRLPNTVGWVGVAVAAAVVSLMRSTVIGSRSISVSVLKVWES